MRMSRPAGSGRGAFAAVANALLVLLVAGGAFTAPAPAGAAPPPDVVIGFEELDAGIGLNDQYGPQGVVFDATPVVVGSSFAHTGTLAAGVVLSRSCTTGRAITTISFTQPHARVSMYVSAGDSSEGNGNVALSAYDAAGSPVGSAATALVPGGRANTLLRVDVPTQTIRSVILEIKQTCLSLYFDDLTFDAPTTSLTVAVTGAGSVTGPGIDCPGDCSEVFGVGDAVELRAAPDAGSSFGGWGGDCASAGTAVGCPLTMTVSRAVTATFGTAPPTSRVLTVSVTGSGKVTGPGIDCPTDCTEQYPSGTKVELTAAAVGGTTFAGWGADCSATGTSAVCSFAVDANRTVSATFAEVAPERRLLTVTVNGSGKVSGPGIDCPSDCTEEYAVGTAVTLTAAPAAGTSVVWAGDCGAAGGATACSLTLDVTKAVVASFGVEETVDVTVAGTPSIGPVQDTLDPIPPPAVETVVINVKSSGTVTSSPGRELASSQGLRRINCGVGGFDCYGEYRPGQALILRARPAPGYRFQRWSGACTGQTPTCRVVASKARTVTAVFAARAGRAAVDAALRRPRLNVRWRGSVGSGNLVVQGWTSVPARVRVDMRRPGGGPLATLRLPVQGAFRQSLPLRRGALSGGARLFPGGFTVALTGRSGKLRLPLQLQTIAIPSPREGVVRKAFVSAKQGGAAVQRLPRGATSAWANFRFESQPLVNGPLTVSWYWPDGRLLGSVRKSNRPVISSFLRLATGLPNGLWRAELRARGRVVQRLAVRVG
jgi:hypothetical protein